MKRDCPYCEAPNLEWIEADRSYRCRRCQKTSLARLGRGEAPAGAAPPDFAGSSSHGSRERVRPRRAPGEGSTLRAAGVGALVTIVFYAGLHLFSAGALFELFAERGWVPYVITGISAWALSLLAGKWRRLRSESTVLDRDLLAWPGGPEIRPGDAGEVVRAIHAQPREIAQSFLADRLTRSLRYFEARRSVVEVVEHLSAESRADDLRVDASYSLVRVFVWAVPTLGFIGTVIGIGGAVGGFSQALDAAATLDGMKESIGSVTGGLGVAFDTTLLALVMSILIMFPANAIQRLEEDLLTRVDDYCTQRLVQRLNDADSESGERFAAAVARHVAQLLPTSRRADAVDGES